MAVSSECAIENYVQNGVLIPTDSILTADEMPIDVLDFTTENITTVLSYYTKDALQKLENNGKKLCADAIVRGYYKILEQIPYQEISSPRCLVSHIKLFKSNSPRKTCDSYLHF